MRYIELSYEKIINEIEEYIIDNRIYLKRKTLKKKNNKSLKKN